jgi:aminoglycoside phosphotransferase (APT) family kinase protein
VPHLEFVGKPSERFPFVFAGHRRIAGRSGEEARPERPIWPSIARQLGEFFSALHGVPVEVGERCGLARETMQEPASLLQSTARYAHVIRSELPSMVDGRMERFLAGDVALPPPSPPPVFVCNADIKGEHIIMSERADAVVGIIDWTDCCLTDRILDFTGVMIWLGESFLRQLLIHYTAPVDESFAERVCFYARCFTLGNLGQRLLGKSDSPLDLLKTQTRWAFSEP